MKRPTLAIAVLAILGLGAGQAFGTTIVYSELTIGSGTMNDVPFTDQTINLTMIGDTTNVSGGLNSQGTFQFSISGVGAGSLEQMVVFVINSEAEAGFRSVGSELPALSTVDSVFATYDLTTAIGPITGPAEIDSGVFLNTTLGRLFITSAGDSTFTASIVPEPSSLLLLGSGVLGLAGMLSRKLGV